MFFHWVHRKKVLRPLLKTIGFDIVLRQPKSANINRLFVIIAGHVEPVFGPVRCTYLSREFETYSTQYSLHSATNTLLHSCAARISVTNSRRWLYTKKAITSSCLESKTRHVHHRPWCRTNLNERFNLYYAYRYVNLLVWITRGAPRCETATTAAHTRDWLTSIFAFDLTYYHYIVCIYRRQPIANNTQQAELVYELCKYEAGQQ